MGRVIIHAGLPKSGSTSIQQWLASHSTRLRSSHGVECVVVSPSGGDVGKAPLSVSAHSTENMNSTALVKWLAEMPEDPGDRESQAIGVFGEVGSMAADADVVLSSEGLWRLTVRPPDVFVAALRSLSAARPTELVAYVRPQNEYLEAAWRQWGFRSGMAPSRFLARQANRADYEAAVKGIAALVPGLTVVVRPVVSGALVDDDVVADFVSHVLQLPERVSSIGRHNTGLPLHVANLLSAAPRDRYFTGPHDNAALDRIKALDFEWPEPPEGVIEESRVLLQLWCRNRYQEGNESLASSQGWDDIDFAPSVQGSSPSSLDSLDHMWAPGSDVDLEETWVRLDEALVATDKRKWFARRRRR